ncbi:MAG: hypothetical protein WC080_02455 [Patescibacteria group bacterium]
MKSFLKQNLILCLLVASLIVGLISTFVFAYRVNAAEVNAGVLKITYDGTGPLFNETNIAPGFETVKTVTVENTGNVAHSFSIATDGPLGSLANMLRLEPRVYGVPVWNKTIADIAKSPQSNVIVGSIAPGSSVNIDFIAILPAGVGNDYQGTLTSSFNFVVGNESTDQSESTNNFDQFNNQNFSTGNQLAEITPVENIQASTNPNGNFVQDESEDGEALGAETSSLIYCYWWWILFIVYALFLIVYGYFNYRANGFVFGWVWPIFGGVVLYLVHWILHDYYNPVKWCQYFVWLELAELVIYYILLYLISSRKESD